MGAYRAPPWTRWAAVLCLCRSRDVAMMACECGDGGVAVIGRETAGGGHEGGRRPGAADEGEQRQEEEQRKLGRR